MSPAKQKLIYLAAASHSGSTLTAMLLGAHPDLCSVGELKVTHLGDKAHYLCSCKTPISLCSFWQGVSEKMRHKGHVFSIDDAKMDIRSDANAYTLRLLKPLVRGPLLEFVRDFLLSLSPNWSQQRPLLMRRNHDFICAVAAQAGVDTVIDSSKIGIRLKYLLKDSDLDIKVIWVVRDGRGVSLAYKDPGQFADAKDPRYRGGGAGKNSERGRQVQKGGHEWVRCNEEIEALLATLPAHRWCKVHYEDICQNTGASLDKLFQFIGVDANKKRLDFKTAEHHIIGNGMRLDDSEAIKLDLRWQTQLSADELAQFESVAGRYQRKMGY